jgi:hypothetical protein
LKQWADQFGGRKTCAELAKGHLDYLKENVHPDHELALRFFEGLWQNFVEDTARVEHADRRAPILYWWDRLQARISEAPAPVERLKPQSGVRTYRLQQAPLTRVKKLWVLGLPPTWLSGEGVGDYWFTAREREVLSYEFAVRSSIQQREERLQTLKAWISSADEIVFLDYEYDVDGRERESCAPVFTELFGGVPEGLPRGQGAHPRWISSYGSLRPTPPLNVQLDPLPLDDRAADVPALPDRDDLGDAGGEVLRPHRPGEDADLAGFDQPRIDR